MRIRGVPELQWYASTSCGFATNKWAHVPLSDRSTQYRLVCFDCQMGLANMQGWICHEDMPRILRCTWTSIICVQKLSLCHKYASRVSYSDISTWILPRLSYSQMGLADMQCLICHNESHDISQRDPVAPDSGRILLFHSKCVFGCRLLVHLKFATDDCLKPFPATFSQFDSRHVSCTSSAAATSNAANQFTSLHMVINYTQVRQWNPTLAISNSTYNNSNIRSLIHPNIEERQDLSIQYWVPYKRPFWLFVSVKKIMFHECQKRHKLMKRLTL